MHGAVASYKNNVIRRAEPQLQKYGNIYTYNPIGPFKAQTLYEKFYSTSETVKKLYCKFFYGLNI